MNIRKLIYAGIVIYAALMISFANFSEAGPRNIVEFEIEITVDRENNGVKLKCIDGCAWETLSFACHRDIECTSSIDENGTPAE